jgi:hypothetical protein
MSALSRMKLISQLADSMITFRAVYFALWVACILAIAVLVGVLNAQATVVALAVAVAVACYCGLSFFVLGNRIPRPANRLILFAGVALVFGGAGFDMYATYRHSPTLDREANIVANFLLSAGLPVEQVLLIGLAAQALLCVVVVLHWRLFLKSYDDIVSALTSSRLSTVAVELFAGPKRGLFALFFGKVDPKFAVISTAPLLTASFTYRWYLGLEWFQVAPVPREVVLVLAFFISVAAYAMAASYSKRSSAIVHGGQVSSP